MSLLGELKKELQFVFSVGAGRKATIVHEPVTTLAPALNIKI